MSSEIIPFRDETPWKLTFLEIASLCTEPVCRAKENFDGLYTLSQTCKSTIQKVKRAAMLVLGMVACALLTPFSAPIGIGIRGAVSACEAEPFIYLKRAQVGKALPDDKVLRVVSHNVCWMPGGYSITDGQVTPPSDPEKRDSNIAQIQAENPDVICLQEVPDVRHARYLVSKLRDYPFVVLAAGTKAVGPSSMLFIASKYELGVKFVPFETAEKTGRAAHAGMGFVAMSLKAQGQQGAFAHGICTHLQPSEVTGDPQPNEVAARALQVAKIAKYLKTEVPADAKIFIAGDFNQTPKELKPEHLNWRSDPAIADQPTWQGDGWCAPLMGKDVSEPCVLDYLCITGTTKSISTKIVETGYSSEEFRPNATSDHKLLSSVITLG